MAPLVAGWFLITELMSSGVDFARRKNLIHKRSDHFLYVTIVLQKGDCAVTTALVLYGTVSLTGSDTAGD